jgi:hypothetical protein
MENDIIAFIGVDGGLCHDCALRILFDDNEEAYQAVVAGTDTSLIDAHGHAFEIVYDDSGQYAQSNDDFFPAGLTCSCCDVGLILPLDELQ